MKTKRIIGKLLLAFVLVSIGFAVGKEVERNRADAQAQAAPSTTEPVKFLVFVPDMHRDSWKPSLWDGNK